MFSTCINDYDVSALLLGEYDVYCNVLQKIYSCGMLQFCHALNNQGP